MKGEWEIIKYRTKQDPPEYSYYMQPAKRMLDARHQFDRVLCTGTWDECVALGKLVGCKLWWDEVEHRYRALTN